MRVAAVLGADGDTIVPLADGPVVAIFESERGAVEKYDNPGWGLAAGCRLAVTEFLVSLGVEAVCSVPEAFCSTSCEVAVQGGIKFIRLPRGSRLSALVADPARYLREVAAGLPAEELFVKPGEKQDLVSDDRVWSMGLSSKTLVSNTLVLKYAPSLYKITSHISYFKPARLNLIEVIIKNIDYLCYLPCVLIFGSFYVGVGAF